MKNPIPAPLWLAAALFAAACAPQDHREVRIDAPPKTRAEIRARQLVSDWPTEQRLLAEAMIDRYGGHDVEAKSYLHWESRAPWKRVVVRRTERDTPIEHVVSYPVAPRAARALFLMGHGVTADAQARELSARSDNESLNILALNLAHEVATGKLSPLKARDRFDEMVRAYFAGKSSPYFERLLFKPGRPVSRRGN